MTARTEERRLPMAAEMRQRDGAAEEVTALALARRRLAGLPPRDVAHRSGTRYQQRVGEGAGAFHVPLLGRVYAVAYPSGEVTALDGGPAPRQAVALLALHYLVHADGHPMADRWATFRELPNGLMYDRAVRGRVEPPLVAAFGGDPERLERAAREAGGVPIAVGDAAYAFDVLPRLRLAVALYLGDEELPTAARLLYDAAAGHYLPTEDLAVLGGMLVGRLLAGARVR